MNLQPIADALKASNLGVEGKTIFINEMPLECKQGILLLESGFGAPIDPYLPDYIRGGFRVATRSVDFLTGQSLAKQVQALCTMSRETLMPGGTMLIKVMNPLHEPYPRQRSVGGYWEFSMEVSITYVNLPAPPV